MPDVPAVDEKLAKTAPGANGVVPPPDPAAAKKAKDRADVAEFARKESARLSKERARDAEMAQLRAQAQSGQALQQQLSEMQRKLDSLESDPLDYLEKKGITARQLGERILKRGTPEAHNEDIEKRIREANESADAIKQELARRDTEARNAQLMAQARKQMFDAHDAVKDKTPLLTKKVGRDRERLIHEYMATYNEVLKDPELVAANYNDEEILVATEARLRLKAEEELGDIDDEELEKQLTSRKARVSSTKESEKASGATGRQESETASSRAKPLTHATTGGSSGSWKPDNWDKLSDKQQNEILTERLRKRLPFD